MTLAQKMHTKIQWRVFNNNVQKPQILVESSLYFIQQRCFFTL